VEQLKGASLGLAALLSNIRQGQKGLPGTNTQVDNIHSQITDVKSFITLCPGANVIKTFLVQCMNVCNKLEHFSLAGFYSLM
jgi:hypothetical protein